MFPSDYIADVVARRCEDPKRIIRAVNFYSPTYTPMVHQRFGQTDRRTTYVPRFSVCTTCIARDNKLVGA